jgi:hypothetical protein
MTEKKFDCVEFQHEAGRDYMRKLRAMSDEEKAAFFAQQREQFRQLQQRARAQRQLETNSTP